MKMVLCEAFAYGCGAGDVVMRESLEKIALDVDFLWKKERVRLLTSSLGASSTPSLSPGPSTPPSYSPGYSTPQSYSLGSSRNAECSNYKHLLDKITVLNATVEMYMHPEQHTVNSAALLHEVYKAWGNIELGVVLFIWNVLKIRAHPTRYTELFQGIFGLQLSPRAWLLIDDSSWNTPSLLCQHLLVALFLSQDKYVKDILTQLTFRTINRASTPLKLIKSSRKDEEDSDYGWDTLHRRSTSGGCHFWKKDWFLAMQETNNCGYLLYKSRICSQLKVVVLRKRRRYLLIFINHDLSHWLAPFNYSLLACILLLLVPWLQQFWLIAVLSKLFGLAQRYWYEGKLSKNLQFSKLIYTTSGSILFMSYSMFSPMSTSCGKHLGHTLLSALVGLATNQSLNFLLVDSNWATDARHISNGTPFLMYPRFVSIMVRPFLNKQLVGSRQTSGTQDFIPSVSLPSKVFTFMRKHSTKFSCRITPLTPSMLEVVTALAAEEEHSTSPHSRAASSARDAQGTPTQSAAHSQRTASVQGTASFQGTATSQGTAEIQRTADFQGTAEPHDAASIPKSPNDYTPTDASQTSGGDEGLLDIYALNREVKRLKRQTLSQAKQIIKLKAKLKKLSKFVAPVVKHHAFWVENQNLKKQKRRRKKHKKKVSSVKLGRNKDEGTLSEEHNVQEEDTAHPFFDDIVDKDAAVTPDLERKSDETEEVNIEEKEASNVKSGETEELDLETTQSTARQGTITPRTLNFEDEAGPSSPLRPIQIMESEEHLKAAEVLVAISRPRGLSIPGPIQSQPQQPTPIQTQPQQPTQGTDPKDKGKGILVKEPKKKKLTLQQIRAWETTNDEEAARKIQADWDAEETKPKTAVRKPTSLAQERNQMMNFLKGQGYKNLQKLKYPQMKELYDKVQASIKDSFKDFIPMDSEKEREMLNEREAKRLLRKRKATISEEQPSKKPKLRTETIDELRNYLRVVDFEKNAQDRESLEGISMITELHPNRQDLYHLHRVVQDYYEHIPPTGLGLMLLGDLTIIWETAETSDDDFWKDQEEWEIIRWRFHESSGVHTLEIEDGTMIHMLAERRYPLSRELMIRMLEHGMEVEDESETAITLIHLFILWTTANGDNS
ncbi:hypothetical protein Tco_1194530 [Tanacetum coccineum]